jgi:hypothetical protein
MRAEIEGLSAGIVEGWGREGRGAETVTRRLDLARREEGSLFKILSDPL